MSTMETDKMHDSKPVIGTRVAIRHVMPVWSRNVREEITSDESRVQEQRRANDKLQAPAQLHNAEHVDAIVNKCIANVDKQFQNWMADQKTAMTSRLEAFKTLNSHGIKAVRVPVVKEKTSVINVHIVESNLKTTPAYDDTKKIEDDPILKETVTQVIDQAMVLFANDVRPALVKALQKYTAAAAIPITAVCSERPEYLGALKHLRCKHPSGIKRLRSFIYGSSGVPSEGDYHKHGTQSEVYTEEMFTHSGVEQNLRERTVKYTVTLTMSW